MTSTHRSKAIVLFRNDFGEADQYVQFLTEQWGVISVLARSAKKSRKRYVGGLDLFCHDEITVRGNPTERGYLTELMVLNSFTHLRNDLEKLLLAGKCVQWVRKIASGAMPVAGLYRLLGQTLAILENESDLNRHETLALIFKLKLLALLGLKPHTEVCVRCDGTLTDQCSFDIAAGGAVCARCQHITNPEMAFSAEDDLPVLSVAHLFRFSKWNQLVLGEAQVRKLNHVVTHFGAFHGHAELPV